jgi:GH24 family phage-related lysozyme (muramidase)/uncharacterized protein (DUF2345 family)
MVNIAKQSTHLPKEYNLDPEGRRGTWDKVYMGYVKGYEDQQHMGRIKVLIPELCGIVDAVGSSEGDNDRNLIIVNYAPPFAGSSPLRGVAAGGTQTSYGMWFRPGIDDAVLCMFVNGDPNRGFWFACLPHVRHSGNPSTPSNGGSVSAGEPSPFADSAGGSVTRPVAAGTTVPASVTGAPSDPRLATSQTVAGTAGVPVIGPSTYGSHNSWDVNGIATPGGNRMVMSDQEGDTQIRLQTRNNLQLLLHNESGMIVLTNGTGNARIEIDSDGNVDIFGKGKISMRSEGDLNLHSDADVNINAGAQLNIRSGGDTKITSNKNMHLLSEQNLFQTSKGDTHRSSNGSMFDTSAQNMHRHSNFGIYDGVVGGNINLTSRLGNILFTAKEQILAKSGEDFRIESTDGSFQLLANQQIRINSQQQINLRSDLAEVNMFGKSDVNIKSEASINIQAAAELNLLAINDAATMQSQNNNVNLHGGPLVVIGPTSSINAGAVPSAGTAGDTESADASKTAVIPNIALAARPVFVREHVVQDTSNRRGGTTAQRVVTSTSTRTPSAEPSPSRFSTSAGYSGTETVERDPTVTVGFPRGAIEPRPSVPLQVMGFVGGDGDEPQRFRGTRYNQDGGPVYVPEPVPTTTFKTAAEFSLGSVGLQDIKNFEGMRGPNSGDVEGRSFDNVCGGKRMIGYGHVLTEDEISSGEITVGDDKVTWADGITESQASELLKQDLSAVESAVKSAVTGMITQQQFDSLVDFAFNIGVDKFNNSEVVSMINSKQYDLIPTEMMSWCVACGFKRAELESRRRANALRFAGLVRSESAVRLDAGPVSQPPSAAVQGARAQQAFDYFVGQGWSREQAAGIVGNLIQESNLNPTALNSRENAQGIAQWTPSGGRQATVARFLGKSVLQASFEEQLIAIQWELNNSERRAAQRLRATVTVDEAAAVVDRYYERSAGTELSQRISNSRALLNRQQ